MNRQHAGARVAGLVVVSTFLGCFTIVEPLKGTPDRAMAGPALKPNLMLLIDNSGSMQSPLGSTTRIDALKAAVQAVLTLEAPSARYGLAVFPENGVETQRLRLELPAAATTDDDAVLRSHGRNYPGGAAAVPA